MSNIRARFDLTAADTKIIGTDYQYFYFIDSILSIKKGQSIGYEVKDDVHISLPCGSLVLIQVKHTIQQSALAQPINLTEKDEDLWKTLSNWALVICDPHDGRSTINEQRAFVEKTRFILATNKKESSTNKFLSQFTKLKKGRQSFNVFQNYLKKLSLGTKGDVKSYIDELLKIDSQLLCDFMLKIEIEFNAGNIIESTKTQIRERNIGESRINDVFNGIFSELKQDFFAKVQAGKKQVITYDEWYSNKRYTGIFENHRTTTLPIRKFKPSIPQDLKQQAFVKELIEIGDIDPNDIEQIALFTSFMLEIKLNLQQWYDDGEITLEQRDRFHSSAITYWCNIHRQCHRMTRNDAPLDHTHAINCLDEIRKKELKMVNTELDIEVSNGEFYFLSNEGDIGWLGKWENRYKK